MGQCALKRKKGAQVRRSEERQGGMDVESW